jgi:tetratricopeptide (TPR) repeat protein
MPAIIAGLILRSSFPGAFRSACARQAIALVVVATLITGCKSLFGPPISRPQPPSQSGTSQPSPEIPTPPQPVPPPTQPTPPTPPAPTKEFRLGAAAQALVKQGRAQSLKGEYPAAIATLERALRIEPDNPLVWLELGQTHLSAKNPQQAESMARKAIALATGNAQVQANGWRLIGDAYRSRGRDLDATEAYQRANAASPR